MAIISGNITLFYEGHFGLSVILEINMLLNIIKYIIIYNNLTLLAIT